MKIHTPKKRIPKPLRTLVLNELDQIINSLFIESQETGQIIPIYKLVPDFSPARDITKLHEGSMVKAGKIPVLILAIQKALFIAGTASTIWLRELLLKGYIVFTPNKDLPNKPFLCLTSLLVKIERFQTFFQISRTDFVHVWEEGNDLNKNIEKNEFGDSLISLSGKMCEALQLIGSLSHIHRYGLLFKEFIKGNVTSFENNIITNIEQDILNDGIIQAVDVKKIKLWHKQNPCF